MQTRRNTLQHSAIVAGLLAAAGLMPAVSKSPFLQFNIKGAKAGDKVSASCWLTRQGAGCG